MTSARPHGIAKRSSLPSFWAVAVGTLFSHARNETQVFIADALISRPPRCHAQSHETPSRMTTRTAADIHVRHLKGL